jgi:competence protein ComEA
MNRKSLFTLFVCLLVSLAMVSGLAAQAKKDQKDAKKTEDVRPALNTPSNPDALDLNTATPEKLMTLPQIDIVLAKKIIAGRPYTNKDQLISKKVLNAEQFNRIARAITVKAPEKPGKKG